VPFIKPPLRIDGHALGKYPAAVILVDKLNNEIRDAALAKRTLKFVKTTQEGLARLDAVEGDNWFNRFRCLWVKERLALVDTHPFHPEIDTYIKNVIKTDSVEWYRSTLSPKQRAALPSYPTMSRDGVLEAK
jgi:hypothetical protein